MKKNLICIILALLTLICLTACEDTSENYVSGKSFELPEEAPELSFARYENKPYGIILEYPSHYNRVGNYDIDGMISFEGDGTAVAVYVPDEDHNDILTAEEYIAEVHNIITDENDGIMTYGKSTGYRYFLYGEERTELHFVVKGIDAFYHFMYSRPKGEMDENDETFQAIMASIRVDDGEYNKLTRTYARYKILLEYATSMSYITDANYSNHCLNTYNLSGLDKDKEDAITALEDVKTGVSEIIDHERDEDAPYEDLWQDVIDDAETVIDVCDEAIGYINDGDIAEAQSAVRTDFTYDLSDSAEAYLSVISTEISEY